MNHSRQPFSLIAAAALGALLTTAAEGAVPAGSSPAMPTANVKVDFAQQRGALLQTERFNNLPRDTAWVEQRPSDVRFFNEIGLHGAIYRAWCRDEVYDPKTGAYDYGGMIPYLTDASEISDSILLNLSTGVLIKTAHATPAQIKPVIKHIIKDLKARFPKIEYIEAENEPDYQYAKLIKPEELYNYYVPFYEAVNEVNSELRPKVPLKVGGPTLSQFSLPSLTAFFDGYKADPSPHKRLDFISYHGYGYFQTGEGELRPFHFFKGNPSEVAGQRDLIESELRHRGLDTNIPSFIDELGLYPGPSFDDPQDPRPDYLRQAAGTQALMYWFMENPRNVPFNWVLRHRSEERKDQLVTRVPAGQPVPTGKLTPYGNSLLMLSKMKKTRVMAKSDSIKDGKGVYVLASQDASGVSVMVWNYQHTDTLGFHARIDLTHLPKSLRGKPTRETVYRIDSTTSNYFANPQTGNLQQVAQQTLTPGAAYHATMDLEPNALELIVLEPASGSH